jgi:hypothetical protein
MNVVKHSGGCWGVRDSSGKPGADERRRGPACPAGRLAADSPTRLHLSAGTPNSFQTVTSAAQAPHSTPNYLTFNTKQNL